MPISVLLIITYAISICLCYGWKHGVCVCACLILFVDWCVDICGYIIQPHLCTQKKDKPREREKVSEKKKFDIQTQKNGVRLRFRKYDVTKKKPNLNYY